VTEVRVFTILFMGICMRNKLLLSRLFMGLLVLSITVGGGCSQGDDNHLETVQLDLSDSLSGFDIPSALFIPSGGPVQNGQTLYESIVEQAMVLGSAVEVIELEEHEALELIKSSEIYHARQHLLHWIQKLPGAISPELKAIRYTTEEGLSGYFISSGYMSYSGSDIVSGHVVLIAHANHRPFIYGERLSTVDTIIYEVARWDGTALEIEPVPSSNLFDSVNDSPLIFNPGGQSFACSVCSPVVDFIVDKGCGFGGVAICAAASFTIVGGILCGTAATIVCTLLEQGLSFLGSSAAVCNLVAWIVGADDPWCDYGGCTLWELLQAEDACDTCMFTIDCADDLLCDAAVDLTCDLLKAGDVCKLALAIACEDAGSDAEAVCSDLGYCNPGLGTGQVCTQCQANADCLSGLCTQHPVKTYAICVSACSGNNCSDGFTCTNGKCIPEVSNGCMDNDVWSFDACGNEMQQVQDCGSQSVCDDGVCQGLLGACENCTNHYDCESGVCVAFPGFESKGYFCVNVCTPDQNCPAGYECLQPENFCWPEVDSICYQGDKWWKPWCREPVAKHVECGANNCAAGKCSPDCQPSCSGKECGPDGCGGNCGLCSGKEGCSANGLCKVGGTGIPPQIHLTSTYSQPVQAEAVVTWQDYDPDSSAEIQLFYKFANQFPGGTPDESQPDFSSASPLAVDIWEDDGGTSGSYLINLGEHPQLAGESFYVYAWIYDGTTLNYSTGAAFTGKISFPQSGSDLEVSIHSIEEDNPSDDDGIVEAGEGFELELSVENDSGSEVKFVKGIMSSNWGTIEINDPEVTYGNILPGDTSIGVSDTDFDVVTTFTGSKTVNLAVALAYVKGEESYTQIESISLSIPGQGQTAPVFKLDKVTLDDSEAGNGDGKADACESDINMYPYLKNTGNASGIDLKVTLSDLKGAEIGDDDKNYPDLSPGQSAPPENNKYFSLKQLPCDGTGPVTADITITWGNGQESQVLNDVTLFTVGGQGKLMLSPSLAPQGVVSPNTTVIVPAMVRNLGSASYVLDEITASHADTSTTLATPVTVQSGEEIDFEIHINTAGLSGTISRTVEAVSSDAYIAKTKHKQIIVSALVSGVSASTTVGTGNEPDVGDGVIVWWNLSNIYGYNIETGENFAIEDGPLVARTPRIDGDWVMYQAQQDDGEGYNIQVKNLETDQIVVAATPPDTAVVMGISGDWIVYRAREGEVEDSYGTNPLYNAYAYNLSTGNTTTLTSYSGGWGSRTVSDADVGDGYAVWRETIGSVCSNVVIHNLNTGVQKKVTSKSCEDPYTGCQRVVWPDDNQGNLDDYHVFMWENGSTKQVTSEETDHEDCVIGCDLIVYEKDGIDGLTYWDLNTSSESLATSDTKAKDWRMDEKTLVWRSSGQVVYTILQSPDIAIAAVSIPDEDYVQGDSTTLTISLVNIGTGDTTGNITIQVSDTTDEPGLLLVTETISGLQAGDDTDVETTFPLENQGARTLTITVASSDLEPTSNNTAELTVTVDDDDTTGPEITSLEISELDGDGDNYIETGETARVSFQAQDSSGVSSFLLSVDDAPSVTLANSPYDIVELPPGHHVVEVWAVDNDDSPATGISASKSVVVYRPHPSVETLHPKADAEHVAWDTNLTVTFDVPVTIPDWLGTPVALFMDGNPVSGVSQLTEGGKGIVFIPDSDLEPDTKHQGLVQGLEDFKGDELPGQVTWSFTTAADDVEPTCLFSSPQDGDIVFGTVTLSGVVHDPYLMEWKLQVSTNPIEEDWIDISSGTDNVNGILGEYDTTNLTGALTFRLEAIDNGQNSAVSTLVVLVSHPCVESGCNDNNLCTDDHCEELFGCVHTDANGGLCDDNDSCTDNDNCEDGACSGIPINCNDDNPCTADICEDGQCQHSPVSGACDDEDACTENDVCNDGVCSGNLIDCNDGNSCTENSCENGVCATVNIDGLCDDADPCTKNDTCSEGKCSGSELVCEDNNPCTSDSCNGGVCVHENSAGICDDEDQCTENDACSNGQCAGVDIECNDSNSCTTDACESGECIHDPKPGSCDDDDLCTVADHCEDGECVGIAVDCSDANPCTADVCIDGKCINTPVAGECDDGDPCTENDQCLNGDCAGTMKDCGDANPCTEDSCIEGICLNTPKDSICNDNNSCTTDDKCFNGMCQGAAIDCDDSNECTDDTCVGSLCVHEENSESCDDYNPCTISDVCKGGACSGVEKDCDDANVCTSDSCLDGICLNAPSTGVCDDQNTCTENDQCEAGVCKGTQVDCDDQNVCTTDSCLDGQCDHADIPDCCLSDDDCLGEAMCISNECVDEVEVEPSPEIIEQVDIIEEPDVVEVAEIVETGDVVEVVENPESVEQMEIVDHSELIEQLEVIEQPDSDIILNPDKISPDLSGNEVVDEPGKDTANPPENDTLSEPEQDIKEGTNPKSGKKSGCSNTDIPSPHAGWLLLIGLLFLIVARTTGLRQHKKR
jgi:hypothetical protein